VDHDGRAPIEHVGQARVLVEVNFSLDAAIVCEPDEIYLCSHDIPSLLLALYVELYSGKRRPDSPEQDTPKEVVDHA
jgi:hypothetical protein